MGKPNDGMWHTGHSTSAVSLRRGSPSSETEPSSVVPTAAPSLTDGNKDSMHGAYREIKQNRHGVRRGVLTYQKRYAARRTMSGAEVRKLRKAAGLTQGALARRLGVQKSTVYRWETGRTRITRPMARLIRLLLR